MKKIAIVQSNYIPWKGYFDLINMADEFVLFDDVQFTRRDWRNRNKIKTPQGLKWLSIPIDIKGKFFQKVNEARVANNDWSVNHWQTIKQFYANTPYFKDYKDLFENFYMNNQEEQLSVINARLIEIVNSILGIGTKITWSSDYELVEGRTEKLLSICQQAGADFYLSGPAARDYLDESLAQEMGIKVIWMNYLGYPEYSQLHPPFEHGVSILDLIFNAGPRAKNLMKSF